MKYLRVSLKTKIALGVLLPALIALSVLSWMHYEGERRALEDQLEMGSSQVGEMIFASLHHALEAGDEEMIAEILEDIRSMHHVHKVLILDADGRMVVDSFGEQSDVVLDVNSGGCRECHELPVEARPSAIKLGGELGVLRLGMDLENWPECQECHPDQGAHLGILLMDISLAGVEERLNEDLSMELIGLLFGTTLVAVGMYYLIHRLVVRRVDAFGGPLDNFASGNLDARIEINERNPDELTDLAKAFNRMAEESQGQRRAEEALTEVRQRAIIQERERIAGELHDGVAQLLGYVNAKASAVRLLVESGNYEKAHSHLRQLEEAAQASFVDVRTAILGLRMAGQIGGRLSHTIRSYVRKFTRLSGLPVDLEIGPGVDVAPLNSDIELQLLRIVQEALSNVQKHSHAERAGVQIKLEASKLVLIISDNGAGFDPDQSQAGDTRQFGLESMSQRARSVGADIEIKAANGSGSQVVVRLPLKGE